MNTKRFDLFFRLVPGLILILVIAFGMIVPTPASPAEPAKAAEAQSLLQFTSGGHVLGFEPGGMFAATGSHALRVDFVDANAVMPLSADSDLEGSGNPEGLANAAPPLRSVTYPNLWNGVTLTYDANAIVRSTYRLEPYADPGSIRLRYNRPALVQADGSLLIEFESGALTETAPIAWQEIDGQRTLVDVSFKALSATEIGFAPGSYNLAQPLFVDPTLTWNTFIGSSNNDFAYGIAVDGSGNVYVTGQSAATWGAPVNPFAGSNDAFAAKLDSNGNQLWNTFMGSSNTDNGYGIALDSGGNVYLAGFSYATWGTPVNSHAGGADAFAARLAANGAREWSTFMGSSNSDEGRAIAVDPGGNDVYVAGFSVGSWGAPVNPYTGGGYEAFAAKIGTVTKVDQTITVNTHAPTSATNGSSFSVAATASSGLAVAYSSSGACTNVGTNFTMTSGAGACTVMYNQAGDSNYNPAPQITESVTPLPIPTTRYVAPTGVDTGNCASMTPSCATITYAISQAVAGNTIQIAPGTYTEAGITVDKNLTLTGNAGGTASTIVQAATSPGTATNRVFSINSGVTAIISNLTIQHGNPTGNGGGILNSSTLTLNNTVVFANSVSAAGFNGGGLYNSGKLTLNNSTVRSNSVTWVNGSGGGIFNDSTSSELIINNSTVSFNSASASGGGIYTANGQLTLISSTVNGNTVGSSGFGGGLFNNNGSSILNNSTISGNSAGSVGGGLYSVGGGRLTLNYTTVSNNSAGVGGGGLSNGGGSGTVYLMSSILAGNWRGPNQGDPAADCSGFVTQITSQGFNLTGSGTGCPAISTLSDVTVFPTNVFTNVLDVLANNGGTTQTHALRVSTSNPALNAIAVNTNSCGTVPLFNLDQRGQGRPFNTRCDIGAYEAQSAPLSTYTLTVVKAGTGNGTITSNPTGIACGSDCSETYANNTVVTLTAAPAIGSTFTGWSGAGCTGTGTCTVTLTSDTSVTATFTLATATLTVTTIGSGSGTVTSSPVGINCGVDCSEPYANNTVVTLTAAPVIGSIFTGWTGAGCLGTGTCTITMSAAKSVTATFTLIPMTNQTITVTAHAPASAVYGSTFTVAATASSGLPVSYSSSGSCTNAGAQFTMTSGTGTCTVMYDQAGDANYNPAPQVTEDVTAQLADQTITVITNAPASAVYGSSFTVAATASSGMPVTYSSSGSCTNVGADFTMIYGFGTCTVYYDQEGSGNYNPAPQVTEIVADANDAPSITEGDSIAVTMSEDGSPTPFALTLQATDPDYRASLVWRIITPPFYGGAYVSAPPPAQPGGCGRGEICPPGPTSSSNVISYFPNMDYTGSDSFDVQVSDGTLTDTITVNVTIAPVNDAPVITESDPQEVTMSQDGSPTAFDLTLHATDIESDPLTWSIISPASYGTATTTAGAGDSNVIGYAPATSYIGTDSFVVEVSDGDLTASITVNVTIRPALIITANLQSITYGSADPAFTFTYSGFIGADGPTNIDTPPTCNVTAAHVNVGSYAITCSGGVDDNYTFNYVDGDLTITAKPITVTADAKSKVYGTADPALTYQVTIGALESGDNFTGALTRVSGENVGTYAISQGTLTIGSNYNLTYVGDDLTITAKAITVTADAKSKVYGTADPALTYQVTSGALESGDNFTGALTRVSGEDVGTYAISQGTLSAGGNYNLTYVGDDLTITSKPITITADPQSKVYGTVDPALTYQVTSGALVSGDSFTGSLTRATGESVGTYAITQGTLSAGSNYTLTFIGNDLTITKATLTVTADDKNIFYGGGDPAFTFAYSGFVGSDTFTDLDTQPTCGVTGAHTNAGTYTISCSGGVDNNYDFTYVNGTLTITKDDQTILNITAPPTALTGEIFSVSADATSNLPVTFSASGACTNIGASFTMSDGLGSCIIRYDQAGDGNYNAAPQVTRTVLGADAPTLLTPADGAQLLNNTPTFDWTDVPAAISYTIQISSDVGFTSPTSNTVTVSTFTPVSSLPAGVTRYWRVCNTTATGPGLCSAIRSFVTASPPSVPGLVAPINDAVTANLRPMLDWTTSTLSGGPAFLKYELQISTDSLFTSPMSVDVTGRTNSDYTPTADLNADTRYYWRVRAFNTLGQFSAWSSIGTFRTPLGTPVLISPAHNSSTFNPQPVFDWTDVPGATGYTIEISTDNSFDPISSPVLTANVTDSTFTPASPLPLDRYYWRVRATSLNGPGPWSLTFRVRIR